MQPRRYYGNSTLKNKIHTFFKEEIAQILLKNHSREKLRQMTTAF